MGAALRDDNFGADTQTVSFDAARHAAAALARPLDRSEDVPIALAAGRVLAAAIEAPSALPPFDQAAMDGYAVCLSGRKGVPVVLPMGGRTNAGDAPGVLRPGTAHRVMTGAALPTGADAVVMQEHVARRGDLLHFDLPIEPGAHIRRSGEDVVRGAAVIEPGRMIGWADIAVLAALGVRTVRVACPLRIAVVTTGSELRDGGEPLPAGAIYDSNGPMLAALLAGPNTHIVSLSVRDEVNAIADALQTQAGAVDLVITTAGMSVGDADHVRDAVGRAGGRLDIVKVAMKPGKPLAFGMIGEAYFAGLPGNPQAAAYGALAFVRPMTRRLLGQAPAKRVTARTAFAASRKPDRTELLPVSLSVEHGRLTARRSGPDGSHRMMPMVSADAVAVVPGASTPLEAGTCLEVLPFDQPRLGG
ncbi:molybdopterin molybdotransferase MoeA [Labrys monachus]|uniref:Molybdopterin molybdenumtransferase n=1 Tax=Labrys monachus TaxID=217067 RepID=A0ABU0FBZ6_9HYPH|nr:gephyrin-like molybdotransferase Glp [Labrys monachus]MDQ0392135.1 molybdopterin molybdotransferase [Labrys monachus]